MQADAAAARGTCRISGDYQMNRNTDAHLSGERNYAAAGLSSGAPPSPPSSPYQIRLTEAAEAHYLLRMITDRSHIIRDNEGKTRVEIENLTDEELEMWSRWGTETEDLEMDDHPEEDDPLEDNSEREPDIWFGEDQTDEAAVQVRNAGHLPRKNN